MDNISDIKQVVVEHFESLFKAYLCEINSGLLDVIPSLVSPGENEALMAPSSMQEVHQAVMSIPAEGADGLDGFSESFFMAFWDIVGLNLVKGIRFLFLRGPLPRVVSASLIRLVPKIVGPKRFSDFCPISIYNCLYKIFSKRFGFDVRWISLVEKCWANNWFSVLINGESVGFFKSYHGLRQGDPLSPSLFIIAVEVLSRACKSLSNHVSIQACKVKDGYPSVSHLLYRMTRFC
ncbi:uncharacterized protein LOC131254148 [Magnolia sinica]|uniref:uncharacterized protein LOC131254148 n=1 Tax=Magnolia sinica TaxID=86752 RepID=UPI002657B059|nr:uncharacterized protein LOC131254148 [Magnolia sinica]